MSRPRLEGHSSWQPSGCKDSDRCRSYDLPCLQAQPSEDQVLAGQMESAVVPLTGFSGASRSPVSCDNIQAAS